jgi:hypothetical protein
MTCVTGRPGKGTYPVDYLVAVFDNRGTALHARNALRAAGWDADSILTFHGPADGAAQRAQEQWSWHQRFRYWWWSFRAYSEGVVR